MALLRVRCACCVEGVVLWGCKKSPPLGVSRGKVGVFRVHAFGMKWTVYSEQWTVRECAWLRTCYYSFR